MPEPKSPIHWKPLSQIFEEQARQHPQAIAVRFYDQSMTYQALNQRANQLARFLRAKGVKPESRVGLCLERSIDMIVAIWGILKAGAAYVPLDPAYPASRLTFMLQDADCPLLITCQKFTEKFPDYPGQQIYQDALDTELKAQSDENLDIEISANSLVYVMYTSGSTGQPKGVMVAQKGWHNYILSARKAYGLQPGECVLQFASLSWDTSGEEIFPCLGSGATLALRTPEMMNSFPAFWRQCADYQISVMMPSTAFWHELVNHLEKDPAHLSDCLRVMVIGGERVDAPFVNTWHRLVPAHVQLFNTYGQTECTAVTTRYRFDSDKTYEIVPIGRPIENVAVLVVDEKGNCCLPGKPGELYVGGVGVSIGYLNQPELTAAKFIERDGQRYYRSGDLVSEIEPGLLTHLGRVDAQIKIRSVRIEPGEIETVLRKHPGVKQALVVGYPQNAPRKLAAYLQVESQPPQLPENFRAWVQAELPEAMCPAFLIPIQAFTLTPNGKIDRNALPTPEESLSTLQGGGAPRNDMEDTLLQLWRQCLNAPQMGIYDNFFDFGGDSLLIVQIITELESRFGKTLPLSLIFHYPSVEKLAAALQDEGWQPRNTVLVPVKPDGTLAPLFCVHADGGAFFYLDFAKYLRKDQPFYGLQAKGLDLNDEPATSIQEAAANYIQALRSVQPQGPYFLGGFSVGGIFAYEMAQQLNQAGEQVSFLAFLDAPSPEYPVYLAGDKSLKGKLKRIHPGNFFRKVLQFAKKHITWAMIAFYRSLKWPLPAELRAEYVRRLNQRMGDLYRPAPYAGPAQVFFAQVQDEGVVRDDTLGWSAHVDGKIDLFEIPGDHETIFKEPNVKTLAETVQAAMDAARSAS
jgi:amino acid adenylation domain-containing protein